MSDAWNRVGCNLSIPSAGPAAPACCRALVPKDKIAGHDCVLKQNIPYHNMPSHKSTNVNMTRIHTHTYVCEAGAQDHFGSNRYAACTRGLETVVSLPSGFPSLASNAGNAGNARRPLGRVVVPEMLGRPVCRKCRGGRWAPRRCRKYRGGRWAPWRWRKCWDCHQIPDHS